MDNTLRKAAEMALEYLNELDIAGLDHEVHTNALRQALAQTEQEPVAWMQANQPELYQPELYVEECKDDVRGYTIPLYTAPPSKPWVSLTDEEIGLLSTNNTFSGMHPDYLRECFRAIEAALRSKNNG